MKMRSALLLLAGFLFLLVLPSVNADYFYTPMNFGLNTSTNHTITVNATGNVLISLPAGFSLATGNLSGVNSTQAVVTSPSVSDEALHVGSVLVNGSAYGDLFFLSIPDRKVVDNKIELGHGDFNYVDGDSFIGSGEQLLFSLVRVWGVGSDVWDEPATNVSFECVYPMELPRTVDSKYTTSYGSTLNATGSLQRLEGVSLFRLFVLSQQPTLAINDSYTVTCSVLTYDFTHTSVVASIPNINLSVRSDEALAITLANETEKVIFTVTNVEDYEVRGVELVFDLGSDVEVLRLDSLAPNESYTYSVGLVGNGTIDVRASFIPPWLFNSRSPTPLVVERLNMPYEALVASEEGTGFAGSHYHSEFDDPNLLTGGVTMFDSRASPSVVAVLFFIILAIVLIVLASNKKREKKRRGRQARQ